jgi:hypothetical protein
VFRKPGGVLAASLAVCLAVQPVSVAAMALGQEQNPAAAQSAGQAAPAAAPQTAQEAVPATAAKVTSDGLQPDPMKAVAVPAVATTPAAVPEKKIFTVPAGTKVLLQLRSSINTKSAKAGDGIYLASTFPVVVGNRVMIPSGVYVQGVVDNVVRAGHVKGKAQLNLHFTSMIFPNGSVVEIPGVVNSVPGAHKQTVKDDGEGTIEQDKDKARNAGKVAEIGIPVGGTVGSIGGLGSGHPLEGGLIGIGAGLAAAGIVALFTRGADVEIASGSQVEMVLQRPLLLEEVNFTPGQDGFAPGMALVPSADQPKPLNKPGPRKVVAICPPGSLGCQ